MQNPIYWESTGILAFKLECSYDGNNWITLSDSIQNKDHFEFYFPNESKENVLLRATDLSNESLVFQSEPFSIFKNSNNSFQHPVDENTVLLMHFENNLVNAANNELNPIEGMPVGYYGDNFNLNLGKTFKLVNNDDTPITHNVWVYNSNSIDLGDNWSIETWVNISLAGGNKTGFYPIIIEKAESFGIFINQDYIGNELNGFHSFVNFSNGLKIEFFQRQKLELNKWYHVAMICDAITGKVSFFVHDKDQKLIYEDSKYFPAGSNGEINQTNNLINIGGLSGASNRQFDGWLDELRITKTSYLSEYKPIVLAELPFYDDFSNDYANWTTYSVIGNDQWHISNDDGIDFGKCARFYVTSNPPQANDDWLVSQIFNTKDVSNIAITFKYLYNVDGPSPEFYYSTSFDGDPTNTDWVHIDKSFWINSTGWQDAHIEIENPGETFVFALRYQVTETNPYYYFLMDNISVEEITTGIKLTAVSQNNLRVFPNPKTDKSIVTFTNNIAGNVTLAIYDLNGRKLFTLVDEKLLPGLFTYPIDINQINPGLYLVSLLTSLNKSFVKLIVTD